MDLTGRRSAWPALPGPLLAAASAGAGGGLAAVLLAERGASQALALLLLPALAVALLRSVWVGYAGVVAVISVLPFATLPLGAAITPTLLEGALLSAYILTSAVLLVDRRERLRISAPVVWWLLLLGVTLFAFLLGVGRGYTAQTARDYGKFVLALGVFWLTLQLVRARADAERLLRLLVLGTVAAAGLGLALYVAGPSVTQRVLTRLVPYGYPSSRIVRYIEDDPARAMRAVGSSIDPNSFGGLLMVGFVLAVGQLLARRRALPVWLAGGATAFTAATLLLTYSRGAWVGAFAGVALIIAARRPRWIPALGALGVAGVAAGLGSGFVERLWLGFTLQDPATKLRLAEYRNAWAIIRRYPLFGVGFGNAPSLDLQTGVSSIYLLIAEQAGLLGLAAFLIVVGVILWRGVRAFVARRDGPDGDLLLGFGAALVAALTTGLVDHYFFNPRFAHMAALFWIVAGALAALCHPAYQHTPAGTLTGNAARHSGESENR